MSISKDGIGIIGENGVSKTTLLKLIAGELIPNQGKIQTEITFNYLPQLTYLAEAKGPKFGISQSFPVETGRNFGTENGVEGKNERSS